MVRPALSILVTYSPYHKVTFQSDVRSTPWRYGLRFYQLKTLVGVKKLLIMKRLVFLSEIWLDSYPTKYQLDWMCGPYSHRSACLFYLVYLSVCYNVWMCITMPFTSTMVGGYVKIYLIIVQPNLACHLGLLCILGFTLLISRGYIKP